MEKVIITSVGTSIFTNYRSKEAIDKVENYRSIDSYWDSIFSRNKSDRPATDIYEKHVGIQWKEIEKIIKLKWFRLAGKPNEHASAEISSIIKIAKGQPCKVHLLVTDTLEAVLAAELIRDWFDEFKPQYNIEVLFERPPAKFENQDDSIYAVKNLKVTDSSSYQNGFQNLFKVLNKLKRDNYKKENILLNITGGYKAIIPAMVLFAQIEDIPFFYLYHAEITKSENRDDLIEWPKLPFGFDYAVWELLEDYISDEKLRQSIKFASGNKRLPLKILETYKVVEPDTLKLTPVGYLLENYLREKTDVGKSMFGYVAELLVFEYFVNKGKKVERGFELNPEKIAFDKYKNDPLEIDLVIQRDDGTEEWCEIKPGTQKKIKEGVKQLEKRLLFLREKQDRAVSHARLILYVPRFFEPKRYKSKIQSAVKKMQKFPDITFSISYFEIPFDEENDIRSSSKMAITQKGIDDLIELNLNEFK